jgi:DNA-binding NarL/FixJ family response regulator
VFGPVESSLRLVVAEDQALVREGIIRMLESAGLTVVGAAVDAVDLVRQARQHQPDVIITDIQMPPGRSDDGLRAAMEIRELYPGMGVIVLSQFLEDRYVLDLVGERADGVGYLLKERVADRTILLEAVRSVAAGQSALDRDVIARLVGRRRANGPLDDLTPQERRVLALMAEGRSNTAIADALTVTVPTVERHVSGIFTKLGLLPSEAEHHRRVVAVLKYLQH